MHSRFPHAILGLALAALLATPALAIEDPDRSPPPQDPPTAEKLAGLIDQAMPPEIQEDNSGLVAQLLKPKVGRSVFAVFDPNKAASALNLRRAVAATDCGQLRLPSGDLDLGDCVYRAGRPDGAGGYQALRFDKNRLLGNIRFVSRPTGPASPDTAPAVLRKLSQSPDAALKSVQELAFNVLGMPPEEVAPASQWTLRSLAVDVASPTGGVETAIVEGLVRARRQLDAGLGKPVPVLGSDFRATINDVGISRASVNEWTPFVVLPSVSPDRARPRSELVRLFSEEMAKELVNMPGRVAMRLVYAKAGQIAPEDESAAEADGNVLPAGQIPDAHKYVPCLLATVSPVPLEMSEADQAKTNDTAGFYVLKPLVVFNDNRK